MIRPAIICIGYNRPQNLLRLLKSLEAAEYDSSDIPLIISLDKSDSSECENEAERFLWSHGIKRVMTHDKRLGLKKHVLECFAYSEEYGAVILLEDDLVCSPGFYRYAVAALEFSENCPSVGGVSLYDHRFNVFSREPFEKISDGYDNYYMQFAQSWGQAVTKKQWLGFKEWLLLHDGEDLHCKGMPDEIALWGEGSWLKYHIRYLVDTDRYFIYPRESHTTNFMASGEHENKLNRDLQVVLSGPLKRELLFSKPEMSSAVYDAFFENSRLDHTSDLYGLKYREGKIDKERFYSTKALPLKAEKTYGLQMRPFDVNIVNKIPGNGIFLYDPRVKGQKPKKTGERISYFLRGMSVKKAAEYIREKTR